MVTEMKGPVVTWRRVALGLALVVFIWNTWALALSLAQTITPNQLVARKLQRLAEGVRNVTPQHGASPVEDFDELYRQVMKISGELDEDARVPAATRGRLQKAASFLSQTPSLQRRLALQNAESVRKGIEVEFRTAVALAHDEVQAAVTELQLAPNPATSPSTGSASGYAVSSILSLLICVTLIYCEWLHADRATRAIAIPVRQRMGEAPPPRVTPAPDQSRALAGKTALCFQRLIASINTCSDMLLDILRREDPMRGDVERIREAGEQAAVLTQELHFYGAPPVPKTAVIDLNLLAQDSVNALSRLAGDGVRLDIRNEEEPVLVRADAEQIRQALASLVLHGRHRMPSGGTLTVVIAMRESGAELTVTDTGPELKPGARAKLFEPAFTSREPHTLGLGLTVTRELLKKNGGEIELAGSPGPGLSIRLTLPRATARKPRQAQSPPQAAALHG